jgi:anthranilate phosphoribosyltransferase
MREGADMLTHCIEKLIRREHLNENDLKTAVEAMSNPELNREQIAAFLTALQCKKPTSTELAFLIKVLKQKSTAVASTQILLDIVGTGGDFAQTVNISTGGAILAAACGVKIAKHGNRAVSSAAGSADVLEALGVVIGLPPEKISHCINQIGIGFCFAGQFHPTFGQMRSLRKSLKIPTVFNFIGPLLNPANPAHLIVGVSDPALMMIVAETLQKSAAQKSMVVHGCGLDEISCAGHNKILEITPENIQEYLLDPADFGFSYCTVADLKGGNAQENAEILRQIFSGRFSNPFRAIAETLILNAGAALYLYGLHSKLKDAIECSKENLYNGSAARLLQNWIDFTHD